MNRTIMKLLLVGVASLAVPAATQATPGAHMVMGAVQLNDGSWLGMDGGPALVEEVRGRAWIGSGVLPAPVVDIALDCLEVSWHQPVYPIPPYLPYHLVQASGLGSDGARYFITAYDVAARPVGFGDFAAVAVKRVEGACGADPNAAIPIQAGDISVLP